MAWDQARGQSIDLNFKDKEKESWWVDHCQQGQSTSANSSNPFTSIHQESKLVVRLRTTSTRRNRISRKRRWEVWRCDNPRRRFIEDCQTFWYASSILGHFPSTRLGSVRNNDYDEFMFNDSLFFFLFTYHHHHIPPHIISYHISNIT